MKIIPLGAAGTVTGSAYLVDSGRARVLLDFGSFQGADEDSDPVEGGQNRIPDELDVRALDAVVLTHAHLDHVGRLPLLSKYGYQGPIFATPATRDMARLVLEDSARIQESDAERANRDRSGNDRVQPLYDSADAQRVLALFRDAPYEGEITVAPGVSATFVESGHMLGSTSIRLRLDNGKERRTAVFSGDLGPSGMPMLRDPETFQRADLVFLESTYGDRDHRSYSETVREFESILQQIVAEKGKALFPSFAIGRSQLLIYLFACMFRNGTIPPIPVYLDSPMAIDATEIYVRHPELADEELHAMMGVRPLKDDLASLTLCETSEQSRQLNGLGGPCAIISTSGMCEGGRIVHHLRHNLPSPSTAVVFTGFQGRGTLGRRLVDGASEVYIRHNTIPVRARVFTLGGFSAHAGQSELLRWFSALADSGPRVALTHGEDHQRAVMAQKVHDRWGIEALTPRLFQIIEL